MHWAGANSDMIVCLTRDMEQSSSSNTGVYFSYNYGKTFENKSSSLRVNGRPAVFDRFYHSPADNMRVSAQLVLPAGLLVATSRMPQCRPWALA